MQSGSDCFVLLLCVGQNVENTCRKTGKLTGTRTGRRNWICRLYDCKVSHSGHTGARHKLCIRPCKGHAIFSAYVAIRHTCIPKLVFLKFKICSVMCKREFLQYTFTIASVTLKICLQHAKIRQEKSFQVVEDMAGSTTVIFHSNRL